MDVGKRAERWLKRRLFGLLLGRGAAASSAVDLASVRRVLVVRANFRMGNLLLVTPALAALRRALPAASIDVVGPAPFLPLLAHGWDLDHLLPLSRGTLANPLRLLRLVRHLRRRRYDLALDGGRGSSFLGALLVGASGARWRVASAGARYAAVYDVRVPAPPGTTHKVDLLLAMLAGLGIEPASRALSVTLTEAERRAAERRWRTVGIATGERPIVVNVGARGAKRWSVERLVELVRALVARHSVPIVLLAGPEERALLRTLRPRLPAGMPVAPAMTVRELAAFLSGCAVVVTPDTGPMHLAAAVGVPTVALLAAPRSAQFAPRGRIHRAVLATSALPVSAVLEAVTAALSVAT